MQFDINTPGDDLNSRPKLSKLGLMVVIGIVIVVVIAAISMFAASASKKAQEKKAAPVILAIERALAVCESSLSTIGAESSVINDFNDIKSKITTTKDVSKKVDIANEAISLVLKRTANNQSLTDELNGSRNRIFVALKNYKEG